LAGPRRPDGGGGRRTIYPLFLIALAGTALVLQIASTRSFFVVYIVQPKKRGVLRGTIRFVLNSYTIADIF
jgi:hypothetical protein